MPMEIWECFLPLIKSMVDKLQDSQHYILSACSALQSQAYGIFVCAVVYFIDFLKSKCPVELTVSGRILV